MRVASNAEQHTLTGDSSLSPGFRGYLNGRLFAVVGVEDVLGLQVPVYHPDAEEEGNEHDGGGSRGRR
eukprot:734132-Rhodomonas_salina.1